MNIRHVFFKANISQITLPWDILLCWLVLMFFFFLLEKLQYYCGFPVCSHSQPREVKTAGPTCSFIMATHRLFLILICKFNLVTLFGFFLFFRINSIFCYLLLMKKHLCNICFYPHSHLQSFSFVPHYKTCISIFFTVLFIVELLLSAGVYFFLIKTDT